jgi:type IV secretion system protein VirB11
MNSKPKISIVSNQNIALNENLKILQPFLDNPKNTEIIINKPGQVITESNAGWEYHDVPELDYRVCSNIAKLTAKFTDQNIGGDLPILSATLPEGHRIQVVLPPATKSGQISLTIRNPSSVTFTLEEYKQQGMFDECKIDLEELSPDEKKLSSLLKEKKIIEFLELAVLARKNIVISGSTGSGKTTFYRTLVNLIPKDERLISIEDVDELNLYKSHPNTVSLFYSANKQGISQITQQNLLESSLRMKPDRVLVAELVRGEEAFYFLRNVNSGHPGSITTIHTNSARMAFEQLTLFIKESRAGGSLQREDIKQLLFMCVDIVVQINNVRGHRVISEIYYDPVKKHAQMV